MQNVLYQPLKVEMAAILASLHAEAFPRGWPAQEFTAELNNYGNFGLLAEADAKEPAGFILCRSVLEEAEILTFAVAIRCRRRGIGRALLEKVLDIARARGVSRIFLEVDCANMAAIQLYRQKGFEEAGLRKAYYRREQKEKPHDSAHDALVMRRNLA